MVADVMSAVVELIGGGAYSIIGVTSQPPPSAAPIGLLGMLAGEQATAVFFVAKSRGPHLRQPSYAKDLHDAHRT